MLEQFITIALPALCGGVAAYVAIKSNLADLSARMNNVEKSIDRAHIRIDNFSGAKK